MKLPRDLSGQELVKALRRFGYKKTRQTGSHMRLTCAEPEHHVTIPDHSSLKIGTLASILNDVAERHKVPRDQLVKRLFG